MHKMTKAERRWLSDIAALGCVVCRNLGLGSTPAEIHHRRTGQGMAQRSSHFEAIPLCSPHHRTGGHGVAIHAGQREFEKRYGTEIKLLEQTKRDVEELRLCLV